jgi:DNA processing protein
VPVSKMVRVYEENGTLLPLWNASYFLLKRLGIDDEASRKFMRYKEHFKLTDFAAEFKKIESMRLRMIRYVDKDYPTDLRSIENPPLILLHKGALFGFENCIAISGTRNPSAYGRIMARKIAKSLAERGFTIVSGLARGIDEWAHCGALEAPRGRTIAVLAWMDPIYPEEHLELAQDLQKRGALLGENLRQPFNRSAPAKFVQRNRITSGISRCVIAIESDEEGGTVHQVKIALSQKRKVLALQPKGNERAKRGFKLFVDLGAIPVKSTRDILDILKKDMLPMSNGSRLDSYYQHSLDRGTFEKNHF